MDSAREQRVRPIERADLASILALNNANAVELGLLEPGRADELLSVAALTAALGPLGAPLAFLIAFDQHAPPQGPNHSWFLARHRSFLYIDRVCVSPLARKRGLARSLYAHALAHAASRGAPVVCCEVNREPPNPVSDAFHQALGFRGVGDAFLPDRGKTVRYLEREVPGVV